VESFFFVLGKREEVEVEKKRRARESDLGGGCARD